MYELSGWQRVPCTVADLMRQSNLMTPLSSLTDPDGIYGHPVIFTEWGLLNGSPLLREYRWPSDDDRDCEHYVPVDERPGVAKGGQNDG
jgi:hypothetical protein